MAVASPQAVAILVSGTASIVQSETRCIGDVEGQYWADARQHPGPIARDTLRGAASPCRCDAGRPRAGVRLHQARGRLRAVRAICECRLGELPIVFAEADVCRPDLLVEIEGVVVVPDREFPPTTLLQSFSFPPSTQAFLVALLHGVTPPRTLRVHMLPSMAGGTGRGINAERWRMRHTAERCDEGTSGGRASHPPPPTLHPLTSSVPSSAAGRVGRRGRLLKRGGGEGEKIQSGLDWDVGAGQAVLAVAADLTVAARMPFEPAQLMAEGRLASRRSLRWSGGRR